MKESKKESNKCVYGPSISAVLQHKLVSLNIIECVSVLHIIISDKSKVQGVWVS